MAGGGAVSSGDGAGRASESGGAREVWQLALSGSAKPADKHPMANNVACFIRISNPWRSNLTEMGCGAYPFGRIASGVSGCASGCAVANSGIAIDVS